MIHHWLCIRTLAVTGALALMTTGMCRAQVIITPTVTSSGGLFHYSYTITNTSVTDDLFDVDIRVNRLPNAVQNIVVPSGFKSAFDSGLGLVDFVEDSSFFTTGTAVSGFRFDSIFSPSNGFFDANFLTLSGGISTVTGRTLTPTGSVPEPGAWAFLGAAVVASGGLFARSRRLRRRNTRIEQGN